MAAGVGEGVLYFYSGGIFSIEEDGGRDQEFAGNLESLRNMSARAE